MLKKIIMYTHKLYGNGINVFLALSVKDKRVGLDCAVEEVLKDVCMKIEKRYRAHSLGIKIDKDQVHF